MKAAKDFFEKCDRPQDVEYILTVDQADHDKMNCSYHHIPQFGDRLYLVNAKRPSNVDGWNLAAANSTGRFLITCSDDWFPPEHWDAGLLKALPCESNNELEHFPHLDGAYALDVDNSDNSNLMAFALVTRTYYERYGYLFHPDYVGLMSDQEFTDVAKRDGVVVNARHLKFRHLNPDSGTVEWDEVYRRHRKLEDLEYGQEVYERRKAAGFPPLPRGRAAA